MRRIAPFYRGLTQWSAIVTSLALLLAYVARHFAYPSPDLMRSIGEVGATAGFGIGGLMGIVAALLVAEHRAAGHHNFLDTFGLWWSAIALVSLGGYVAMHPVIVDRWGPKQAG
jgi:hypothetical protein